MMHDPLLNTYFLGNGHRLYECTVQDCIGCAVTEAFADFNNGEKAEGFGALNLLLATWRASPVSLFFFFFFFFFLIVLILLLFH